MTETETESKSDVGPVKLDLNTQYFWAINERSDVGIPAVELDITTGKYAVLIWTSKEAALKYCYLRKPEAAKNLYQLPRRSRRDALGRPEILQVGLLKVARRILLSRMEEITHFIIDHPGAKGTSMHLSVEDMAYLGRKPVPSDLKSAKDLKNFLDAIEEEDA